MLRLMVGMPGGEETYSPSEASRILSRGGRSLTERRIRQMLQAGELEGEKDEGGRWRLPRRVVPRFLTAHPDYLWLNRLQCIGVGQVNLESLEVAYDVYALR